MLEDAIGNSKFISAVKRYLSEYQFRNAESRDLFDIFGNSTMAAVDVADFVDRWLRFPGFPVINVRRDNAGFQLSRRRFATSRRFRETIEYVSTARSFEKKEGGGRKKAGKNRIEGRP